METLLAVVVVTLFPLAVVLAPLLLAGWVERRRAAVIARQEAPGIRRGLSRAGLCRWCARRCRRQCRPRGRWYQLSSPRDLGRGSRAAPDRASSAAARSWRRARRSSARSPLGNG